MLRKISRFRRLSPLDRAILIQALVILPIIQVRLRTLGFKRAIAPLIQTGDNKPLPSRQASRLQALRTAHLMHLAAKHGLVRGNCLSRALALLWLLRKQGMEGELRIGVRKAEGQLLAHAWIEVSGQPLAERGDVTLKYAPFEKLNLPQLVHWA